MKVIMRYRGLLAVLAALMLAYPAFLFGQHMGDLAVSELPQHFDEHPVLMTFLFALNLWIIAVTWGTCICKRSAASKTNS